MKKLKLFVFTAFLLLGSNLCLAASLDDIYRDVVLKDNQGYLPMFVKNRHAPDFLDDTTEVEASAISSEETIITETPPAPIYFEDRRKERKEQLEEEKRKWEETISAVKKNRVTPNDLAKIDNMANNNNPRAVELYAWMFATGTGVNQNLLRAFSLYHQADNLNVGSASSNMSAIYKIMTPEQREQIKSMKF